MTLSNELTIRGLGLAVARTACAVFPFAGCGDGNHIDRVGSETLAESLDRFLTNLRCVTRTCEGKKDKAPLLPEGTVCGSCSPSHPEADLVADPVEGTAQLAGPSAQRTRGSSCVVALAPAGSVANLYSGCYAHKLVLPPGSPAGISLETPPGEIVRRVGTTFGRRPAGITVWLLDRPRNQDAINAFRQAGANVRLIAAGDFESHLRAGDFVSESGPVHISYGIGGLPEGVLAVPFLLWSGATMLLKPYPLQHQLDEIRSAGCYETLGREYDARSLIDSDDCILAVAGITNGNDVDHPLVKGIYLWDGERAPCVTVLLASPALRACRLLEVTFEDYSQPRNRPAGARQNTERGEEFSRTDTLAATVVVSEEHNREQHRRARLFSMRAPGSLWPTYQEKFVER